LRNRVNFDGMAKMFSTLLPLGTTAPEFFLLDDRRPRRENALPVKVDNGNNNTYTVHITYG
jgi:hypothetical protein